MRGCWRGFRGEVSIGMRQFERCWAGEGLRLMAKLLHRGQILLVRSWRGRWGLAVPVHPEKPTSSFSAPVLFLRTCTLHDLRSRGSRTLDTDHWAKIKLVGYLSSTHKPRPRHTFFTPVCETYYKRPTTFTFKSKWSHCPRSYKGWRLVGTEWLALAIGRYKIPSFSVLWLAKRSEAFHSRGPYSHPNTSDSWPDVSDEVYTVQSSFCTDVFLLTRHKICKDDNHCWLDGDMLWNLMICNGCMKYIHLNCLWQTLSEKSFIWQLKQKVLQTQKLDFPLNQLQSYLAKCVFCDMIRKLLAKNKKQGPQIFHTCCGRWSIRIFM